MSIVALVFGASVILANILIVNALPHGRDGLWIQTWASDMMMQCLPIVQLQKTPFHSLWYLHIQPPALDALRSLIAQFYRHVPPSQLLRHVDRTMYAVHSLMFGVMNAVLFSWARRLRGAVFAGVFVLFWAFRPAPLFYLVLLEGTFLSALLILLFLYDFYGKPPGERSPGRLALWPVLLFYTRTFFQWYFVPVYAVALLLRRCPPGKVLRTVVISAVLIAPLLIKQHALYGTLATTTYDGYHQTGLLWYHPTDAERAAVRSTLTYTYPPEADRYSGGMVLNSSTTVIDNLVLTRLAARFYKAHPADAARGLIRSARLNFRNYWRPSATYTANALIAELPWRKAYMKATGGVVLPIVLLLAALSYAFRRRPDPRETAGRLVPVLFIFATSMFCNRYGWTEALRFKFFLEPLYWLFIFAEAHALFWGLRHYGIHLREET